MRTKRLTKAYELRIRYTHFPLHPDTPPSGRTLEDLFANRRAELEAMRARLPLVMAREGLDYGDRSMTYNSRLAQELATWAETQPGDTDIHQVLFRAYFVECLNLSDVDVLRDLAVDAGLSGDEARDILTNRRFRGAVDRDWNRSMELGVTAVPTYVVGNRALVGAQPYEMLERLVRDAGANRIADSLDDSRLG